MSDDLVKRYQLDYHHTRTYAEMAEDCDGDWVKYSDYKAASDRKRRSHEEDEKERSDMRLPPRLSSVVREDTADMICKDALIWHRTQILDDLIAFEDSDEKRWIHPDDVSWKRDMLKAMNTVLYYWGVGTEGTNERRRNRGI